MDLVTCLGIDRIFPIQVSWSGSTLLISLGVKKHQEKVVCGWLMKTMAHPSENHSNFSPSSGCLVYGKSPGSSSGGFPSFSLRRETQFYCRHQCTQLSTRISLVYLLSIFEMSAIIFNSETMYFLIIRVRTAGL